MKLVEIYPGDVERQESLKQRFWEKVNVGLTDDCWNWTACVGGCGPSRKRKVKLLYGRFALGNGRTSNAHRIAFMLANGEVPDDRMICHRCDNPLCVNPAHLFSGTAADNAEDRDRKGRYVAGANPRGEQHHSAKLTDAQVREIRQKYSGICRGHTAIGREYGVCHAVIRSVLRRQTWKHV